MTHFLPYFLPATPSTKKKKKDYFKQTHFFFPSPPSVKRNSTTLQLPKVTKRNKNNVTSTKRVWRTLQHEHLSMTVPRRGRQGRTGTVCGKEGPSVTAHSVYKVLRQKYWGAGGSQFLREVSPKPRQLLDTLNRYKPGPSTTLLSPHCRETFHSMNIPGGAEVQY